VTGLQLPNFEHPCETRNGTWKKRGREREREREKAGAGRQKGNRSIGDIFFANDFLYVFDKSTMIVDL